MILSQKNIEEIAVAVIRDFQKSFFGSEADNPARFALPTPIDQFASDYLNLKVSFQKLSSDGSIYGLTAYVDTEYQIEVDGSQRSIFLKTNDVVLDKSFIEPANIRKLCGKRRFTLAHECAHQTLFQLDADGTDRLHGAKAYIRALSKVLANPDKIDALNNKTPSIDLVCTLLYLESIYNALNNGRPHMALKNPAEDSQFLPYAFDDVWAYVRARL